MPPLLALLLDNVARGKRWAAHATLGAEKLKKSVGWWRPKVEPEAGREPVVVVVGDALAVAFTAEADDYETPSTATQ